MEDGKLLDNIAEIFDESQIKMGKLKKHIYEERMAEFRTKHGHYIDEMLDYIKKAADKKATAEELADILTQAVFESRSKKSFFGGRKIEGNVQAELNIFMIYYVFPAILLTEDEDAVLLCDSIKATWGSKFKNSKIDYADYQTMYDNFNEKLMGIF